MWLWKAAWNDPLLNVWWWLINRLCALFLLGLTCLRWISIRWCLYRICSASFGNVFSLVFSEGSRSLFKECWIGWVWTLASCCRRKEGRSSISRISFTFLLVAKWCCDSHRSHIPWEKITIFSAKESNCVKNLNNCKAREVLGCSCCNLVLEGTMRRPIFFVWRGSTWDRAYCAGCTRDYFCFIMLWRYFSEN